MQVLDGHKSAVYALAFAPDGRLASGDREGTVLLWSGREPKAVVAPVPPGPDAAVNALAFATDGELAVGGATYLLRGYFGPGGDCWLPIKSADSLAPGVTGVVLVGTERLAIGYGSRSKPEGGRLVLDARSYQPGRSPEFPAPKGVRSVSAAGGVVAWSEWGRVAYIWDIRKPDRLKWAVAAEIACVALAPDGTQLAAGVDYKVKLYDVAGKRERLSLDGHTGRVTGVAFTPDGGSVVSGSWDGTVRLWDATSGSQRAAFQWPVGKVTSLAVSPDGLRLAVGGDTGAVVLADLD